MVVEKACKNCKRIIKGSICPICKKTELTASWKGFVVVVDPERSEIAEILGIETPGKYALRIGK